jgi:hypothetical protein
MKPIRRYIDAFFIALRMTLRGETPQPPPRDPALAAWLRDGLPLLDAVYTAADGAGLRRAQREALTLRIDGREMKLETLLGTLRFHLAQEYPSLLRQPGQHNLLAIRAGCMNDRYWVSKLRAEPALQQGGLPAALERLATHLEALPKNS